MTHKTWQMAAVTQWPAWSNPATNEAQPRGARRDAEPCRHSYAQVRAADDSLPNKANSREDSVSQHKLSLYKNEPFA